MNQDTHTPVEIGPTADGSALQIHWADGHTSIYEPRALRLRCPCAECVDEMTGLPLIRPGDIPEAVYPTEIQYVGRYALTFVWSDGHSTGIFPFDYLRQICPCDQCRSG